MSIEPHFSLVVRATTVEIEPQQLVKAAIAAQADLVIAAGGDGTVSAVAGALIGTGIPLGIIPRETNPPQKVVVDGEPIGTTPIKIECIPAGITVFVPETLARE
jgi:diacylglycerol kinase family enzyme